MTISTIQAAHSLPVLVNVAVNEEWLDIAAIRDECPVCKQECLTLFGVVGEAGGFTHNLSERLLSGVAESAEWNSGARYEKGVRRRPTL